MLNGSGWLYLLVELVVEYGLEGKTLLASELTEAMYLLARAAAAEPPEKPVEVNVAIGLEGFSTAYIGTAAAAAAVLNKLAADCRVFDERLLERGVFVLVFGIGGFLTGSFFNTFEVLLIIAAFGNSLSKPFV